LRPDIKKNMTREQIDAVIIKHADNETLYDQPYEDSKCVRVCGPFSVESLSPHRVLSTADENQSGTATEHEARKQQDFANMILENLKKAGVQNTRKGERLAFDRLDPYAGKWLHAAGEYNDADGKTRRVAVSIGPEHGTVGPQQVKEAAKEAVQGVGFDMLIVCGFAFDPHVAEEVKRYGKLTVLPTKMNPDLAMGDELGRPLETAGMPTRRFPSLCREWTLDRRRGIATNRAVMSAGVKPPWRVVLAPRRSHRTTWRHARTQRKTSRPWSSHQ
jgi:adenine-specific DNA-methyltransferase